MSSLNASRLALACALTLAASPAAADPLVTTTDTDGGPLYTLLITSPLDNSIILGGPEVVVPVTIEFSGVPESYVGLRVDGVDAGNCVEKPSPCTIDVTLAVGEHILVATAQVFADEPEVESPPVDVEVMEIGATTGPTTGDDSSGGSDGSGTTDSSTGGPGSTSGGDDDKNEGCACATEPRSSGLFALALALLLAPRRRRSS